MSVAIEMNNSELQDVIEANRAASTAAKPFPGGKTNDVESVKLDLINNWTSRDELPFEPIAERTLEIAAEEHGQSHAGAFTITFAKPVEIEGMGWACVFRMSAMGRVHVSPARGVDAVDALQQAFALVHKQLTGMGRMHKITFGGSEDLGFGTSADAQTPKAAGCPVMGGAMGL